MARKSKESIMEEMRIIDLHTRKYRTMMIVFAALIAAAALFLCIYWNYDENSAGAVVDYIYLASHILFLVSSLAIILVLVLDKFGKVKTKTLAFATHIYSFQLIALSTVLCILDLGLGLSPFIYLLACVAVSGLFVTEPRFFIIIMAASFTSILVYAIIHNSAFFSSDEKIEIAIEDISNFAIFAVLVSLVCIRHFRVTIREHKAMEKLHVLTYYDELTGLLNERSYLDEIDSIAKRIEEKRMEGFALVMMDVNNLKATNDAYGHRYGCHLVVEAGHTIPKLFPSSKCFHVGGDEFIAIVYGDDYVHFQERMEQFDKTMTYSLIQYEGKELIFSVARGFTCYQEGDRYQDVLQRADNEMYTNKKAIKEKYNMKGR